MRCRLIPLWVVLSFLAVKNIGVKCGFAADFDLYDDPSPEDEDNNLPILQSFARTTLPALGVGGALFFGKQLIRHLGKRFSSQIKHSTNVLLHDDDDDDDAKDAVDTKSEFANERDEIWRVIHNIYAGQSERISKLENTTTFVLKLLQDDDKTFNTSKFLSSPTDSLDQKLERLLMRINDVEMLQDEIVNELKEIRSKIETAGDIRQPPQLARFEDGLLDKRPKRPLPRILKKQHYNKRWSRDLHGAFPITFDGSGSESGSENDSSLEVRMLSLRCFFAFVSWS